MTGPCGGMCAEQAVYSDGLGPIRGGTNGRDFQPDVDIALVPGDRLVGAFGSFSFRCCGDSLIMQLGFRAASGAQYGPYGSRTSGTPFAFQGTIYGFFGGVLGPGTAWDRVAAFGFWTESPSPPPAPPARSPPPAVPPVPSGSPSPPPVQNLGRIQTYAYGYMDEGYWDEGALYSRKILGAL